MNEVDNIIELGEAVVNQRKKLDDLEKRKKELLKTLEEVEHQIRLTNFSIRVKKELILKKAKRIAETQD